MTRDAKRNQRAAEKRKRRQREIRAEKIRRNAGQVKAGGTAGGGATADMTIEECVISKGWYERGLAHILIARRCAPGTLTAAGYFVDTLCAGLKNTALLPRMTDEDYQKNVKPNVFNDAVEFEACDPGVARTVIEGAIAFAERYGFRPNKRWAETRRFLEGIEPSAELIPFGRDGVPCLMLRRGEAEAGAIAKLERRAGAGNYLIQRVEQTPSSLARNE